LLLQDMARLVEDFKVTKEEMISRHEQELEKLRLDMEASLRSQEQATEALVTATISSAKEESNLSLQKAQKEKETALAALQEEHQQEITKIIIEADAEKEELVNKHKRELAEAVALSTVGVTAAATTTVAAIASSDKTGGDVQAANAELEGLKDELCTLRKAEEEHMQRIEALMQENKKLLQQLEDTKAGLKTQHEANQPTAVVAAVVAAEVAEAAAATEAAVADNSSSDPNPNLSPKPLDSTLSTTSTISIDTATTTATTTTATTATTATETTAPVDIGSSETGLVKDSPQNPPADPIATPTHLQESSSDSYDEVSWSQFAFPMAKSYCNGSSQVMCFAALSTRA
jgi:septal ring factor EnvC (AmiA/AmiB activator)